MSIIPAFGKWKEEAHKSSLRTTWAISKENNVERGANPNSCLSAYLRHIRLPACEPTTPVHILLTSRSQSPTEGWNLGVELIDISPTDTKKQPGVRNRWEDTLMYS